jgi:hypothetical protein
MRGTNSNADFDKFVKAVAGFPPTERDGKPATRVFAESYELLDDLAKNSPFPRALAWKAYALALSVYEGWPLPNSATENGMDSEQRLNEAWKLADAAIKEDDTDYDLHWAMADVYLIQNDFANAKKEFERALYLNRDERHPSLFAEAASAMMQADDLDKAQMYFRKARTPDWHHWMKGILLFIKAGRAGQHQETFLNLALDELKSTHAQLGDDFYQHEIQLILAVVHWRKWLVLSDKAANIPDPGSKALIQNYAERNRTAAQRAIRAFRLTFKHWKDVKQAETAMPFQNPNDGKYWLDAAKEVWDL